MISSCVIEDLLTEAADNQNLVYFGWFCFVALTILTDEFRCCYEDLNDVGCEDHSQCMQVVESTTRNMKLLIVFFSIERRKRKAKRNEMMEHIEIKDRMSLRVKMSTLATVARQR